MALGSKKRDYVTSARSVQKSLATHSQRMAELMAGGMDKEAASAQAYNEQRTATRLKAKAKLERRLAKLQKQLATDPTNENTKCEIELITRKMEREGF